MTTERTRTPARQPTHWRVKQVQELLNTLAQSPAPVTYTERWHYEANLAQAAAWLTAALQFVPPPSSTRATAPTTQPPKELVMAPHLQFENGRRCEVWRQSDAAERRYRDLYKATPRDLDRAERLLSGDMRVGSKLVTYSYPSTAKVPAIEGVPS